jgi:hypothetical protein
MEEATLPERTQSMDIPASSAASRRVFRSKVDSIRPTYGFEDVSLAPGTSTIEPADVELAIELCGISLGIPILAAAMDAVVDPRFAGELARLGGLAILNLEGIQTRYEEPDEALERIATAPDDAVTRRGRGNTCVRAAVRPILCGAWRGPLPRPITGEQRPPPRDRL